MIGIKRRAVAPRLLDKKHRMVCYFFDKLFDLMIDPPNMNLSQNEFESFASNRNRAQDDCLELVDNCNSFYTIILFVWSRLLVMSVV
jgi:hypothetical protein